MALDDAGLAPGEIAYLNLHGTGTPQNDVMEAAAVARVLGERVPCSSTKPLVGHTLGAAGAIEAAFCWLVLAERTRRRARAAPARLGRRARPRARADPPGREGRDRAPAGARPRVMTNSFGFGGNNCTLDPRRGRAGVKASLLRWSAWAPGIESPEPGRRGRARPSPLPPTVYPTRSSCPRCCGAAARRSPAPC